MVLDLFPPYIPDLYEIKGRARALPGPSDQFIAIQTSSIEVFSDSAQNCAKFVGERKRSSSPSFSHSQPIERFGKDAVLVSTLKGRPNSGLQGFRFCEGL